MKMVTKLVFVLIWVVSFQTVMMGIPHRFIDNAQEFETMLAYAGQSVFVTFSAPWCGVCNTIKEPFVELMQDPLLKEKVTFVTVDFDKTKDLCTKYKVDRIPTFLYFKDGKMVRQDIGVKRGVDVKQFFQQSLQETFQLVQPVQQASNNAWRFKSVVSSLAVPPLRYLKDGIDWCIKKLTV